MITKLRNINTNEELELEGMRKIRPLTDLKKDKAWGLYGWAYKKDYKKLEEWMLPETNEEGCVKAPDIIEIKLKEENEEDHSAARAFLMEISSSRVHPDNETRSVEIYFRQVKEISDNAKWVLAGRR